MTSIEFWTSHHAAPTRAADFAGQAEALGWHGITTVDSQNLSGDADHCLRRLEAVATLGIGKIAVTGPNFAARAPEAQEAAARFTELVMPRMA